MEPATGFVHEDVFPENGKAVHNDCSAGGHYKNGDGLIGSPGSSPRLIAVWADCAQAIGIRMRAIANVQVTSIPREIHTNSFQAVPGFML